MKKIIFLVTEDWYFYSHRLPVARAARDAGFEVLVATRVNQHGDQIKQEGFRLIELQHFKREANQPLSLLYGVWEIIQLYRRERPDLLHHVALKPAVVGSFAAKFTGIAHVVNAVAGMGFVFSSESWKAKLFRPLLKLVLEIALKGSKVIVQNPDDAKFLAELIKQKEIKLIRGSGVDIQYFVPLSEPEGIFTVALVSRMLWDKGVGEFVESIRQLRLQGINVRALLAGTPDSANLGSISQEQLEQWNSEGIIEFLGHVEDVRKIWSQAHVAVLPSYYREGLPKCLLEAAACGRPIVTTDTPGCREVVQENKTGLLVPVRDSSSLAEALSTLEKNKIMRIRMGKTGRLLVEQEFSSQHVAKQTMALYQSILEL